MIQAVLDNLRTYWIVHLLLLAYTAVLAHHAWSGKRGTRAVADYFVGGRSLGPVAVGLSFFATYSSTNSFVGFSGQAYDWGVTWFLFLPFVIGLSLFSWVAVAPRLRTFTESLGSLTIPDFIGFRFGSPAARVMAAFIVLFASFFYMTAVFKGIGNLLEVFLDIPYRSAIVLVFLIVMLYTMVGGFISVVKTDGMQGLVMIAAAILLFGGTVAAAGGLDSVAALADDPRTAPLLDWGGGVSVPLVLGVVFAGTVKFVVEPRQLSRFYALESRSAARRAVWVSTAAFLLVYTLLIPVGLYARHIIPGGLADSDLVVPRLLAAPEVFPAGIGAFLLVAMVAAAMSSLDSVLLVMASTAERDIAGVVRGSRAEQATIRATRAYVALFALVTALIALSPPGGIIGLTAFSGAVYGACFGPVLLLGLYWRRGDGRAAVASFVTGLAVLLLWYRIPGTDGVHQVFPAVTLSFLVYWAVARWTPGYESPELDRLFAAERSTAGRRNARPGG